MPRAYQAGRTRKAERRTIPPPMGVFLLVAIGLTSLYAVLVWGWGLDRGLALTVYLELSETVRPALHGALLANPAGS